MLARQTTNGELPAAMTKQGLPLLMVSLAATINEAHLASLQASASTGSSKLPSCTYQAKPKGIHDGTIGSNSNLCTAAPATAMQRRPRLQRCMGRPDLGSSRLNDPVASSWPSERKARLETRDCPVSIAVCCPVVTSHSRTWTSWRPNPTKHHVCTTACDAAWRVYDMT